MFGYSLDLPGACGRIGSKTGKPADGRAKRTGRAASTTCRAAAGQSHRLELFPLKCPRHLARHIAEAS